MRQLHIFCIEDHFVIESIMITPICKCLMQRNLELGEMIHMVAAAKNRLTGPEVRRRGGVFITRYCQDAINSNNVYLLEPGELTFALFRNVQVKYGQMSIHDVNIINHDLSKTPRTLTQILTKLNYRKIRKTTYL